MKIMKLPLNGLRAGEWDIIIKKIISSGCNMYAQTEILRVVLIKNTTWKNILKALPKGSLIKDFYRVR